MMLDNNPYFSQMNLICQSFSEPEGYYLGTNINNVILENYRFFFHENINPSMFSSPTYPEFLTGPSIAEILFSFGLTFLIIYMISFTIQVLTHKIQTQEEQIES